MDEETAALAVLPRAALAHFRAVCAIAAPIEPRFDGYTKHVLLSGDRAFLFPRNHTVVGLLERECAVYATLDHPLVPRLLGRWDDPRISPYPFFAVTRLGGRPPAEVTSDTLPGLAVELGAALAACHDIDIGKVPQVLWTNAWTAPPSTPPTAASCFSPLRLLGGAQSLAVAAVGFVGAARSAPLLAALEAAEAMPPALAHGDLHEGQLLVDGSGALSGVLDWGFGGALSPLVEFTASWSTPVFAAEAAYGDLRRHMWAGYAARRSAPLPVWEHVHLALLAFDINALAPDTRSHYHWQESPSWRAARRAAAGEALRAIL